MDDQSQPSDSFNLPSTNNDPIGNLGAPPVDSPLISKPDPSFTPTPDNGSSSPTPTSSDSTNSDDLVDIKKQALAQLSPLVKNLNQNPEEHFKTTMMMIQAGDDRSLIKEAYNAAQQITDEKAKAQALLDVVNEINYFTQHSGSDQ